MAGRDQPWWLEVVPFFDVRRQRIWVFWRRGLPTAPHRTQLSDYLRLLGRKDPSNYGPTADVTWQGPDTTGSLEAAERKENGPRLTSPWSRRCCPGLTTAGVP